MKKKRSIRWKFSEAQKEYLEKCPQAIYNFAEGAVRSGKTVCNILAFARELETAPDRLHLATGLTLSAAKLNLGDCNGYGLEHLFRGRCRWGRYHDNPALFIQTQTGQKIVLFAGGGKADSYKRIRGNSYGMWIATEVNKHYLSDDDASFVQEAFNRQLAAKNRKVFWDLNPDYPQHPIYTKYIDRFRTDGLAVNYRHFTIYDNPSVSREQLEQILLQYPPGSIWHRRWILGERCAAEGLIFPEFTEHPEHWTVDQPPEDLAFVILGRGSDHRSGVCRNDVSTGRKHYLFAGSSEKRGRICNQQRLDFGSDGRRNSSGRNLSGNSHRKPGTVVFHSETESGQSPDDAPAGDFGLRHIA